MARQPSDDFLFNVFSWMAISGIFCGAIGYVWGFYVHDGPGDTVLIYLTALGIALFVLGAIGAIFLDSSDDW